MIAFESVPNEFVSKTGFYDHKKPLTEALAQINKYGAVVVTKNGEYYGVVDDRAVVRKGSKISKSSAISKFASKVPVLDSSTSIEKAIHQFYSSGAKALPYYENKKITGVVNRSAMLKAILSLHLLSKYTVAEIMSTPVIAIDSDATVSNAKSVMRKSNLKRLVVLSKGKLNGILTSRQILELTGSSPSRMPELSSDARQEAKVGDIAERNVHFVEQAEDVESAIRELVENKVSSLVVTRSGRPSGIVTVRDIFEAVSTDTQGPDENIIISGLDDYTTEFRDDIMSELESLEGKINKFHNVSVDSITFNIKRHRAKNYEMKLRVWLAKKGVVSSAATGFSLEGTLRTVVDNVYNSVKEKKEIIYTDAKKREHDAEDHE